MDKTLYINEFHEKIRIEDPTTFAKEYCKRFKKLSKANISLEVGQPGELKRVKVKSVRNKKLTEITPENFDTYKDLIDPENGIQVQLGDYMLSCEVLVKIFD